MFHQSSWVRVVIVTLAIAWVASVASAQEAANKSAPRGVQEIMEDIQREGNVLSEVVSDPQVLMDPAKRAEHAPKLIPVLRKLATYSEELKKAEMPGPMIAPQIRSMILPMLVLLEDRESVATMEKQAAGTGDEAIEAKTSLLLGSYWRANKDAAAQSKILDEVESFAKANPKSDFLTQALMGMSHMGSANPAHAERVAGIISDVMQSESAAGVKEQLAADRKLKAMEGKELTLSGVTHDGKQFTTADWKGNVILVDFWATWCGPCMAEMPRVTAIYKKYQGQGLKMLGVSCDNDLGSLEQFLKANPDKDWPQLFDAKNPGWHALAKEYGIQGIPTMFLIDKKGVLRTVEARSQLEEMIPKLLAE